VVVIVSGGDRLHIRRRRGEAQAHLSADTFEKLLRNELLSESDLEKRSIFSNLLRGNKRCKTKAFLNG
jgi:hypothetical protein